MDRIEQKPFNCLLSQNTHPVSQKKSEGHLDTFTAGSRKDITANYYPQDPSVSSPVKTSLPADGITQGPDNARIDTIADVKQDKDGNFIFTPDQVEFMPVQTFAVTFKTINAMEKYLGKKIQWSFPKEQIAVYPDKGKMMNAFYNKKDGSLNFFHFTDKKTGETVHTGKSFDTVSHEAGHALLDGMKPSLLGWNIETEAFHESFSDITSMLSALNDENNIKMFLSQTEKGFKTRNCISETGEQFANAALGKTCIRSAVNEHNYKNPYTLPMFPTGKEDELTGEAHNFCQVFTGAFYDIMEKIYALNISSGMSPQKALTEMRDTCGRLLMKGTELCPPSNATYKDIAKCMIEADRVAEKGRYKNILSQVFENRWILSRNEQGDELIRNYINLDRINPENPESIRDFVESNREKLRFDEDVKLRPPELSRNINGSYTAEIMGYSEVVLKGAEFGIFEGASVEIDQGVTFSFDKSGKFNYLSGKGPDADAINKTKDALKSYIKKDRIRFFDPSVRNISEDDLFNSSGVPYIGYTVYEDGRMKIVRSPILCW